MCEFVRKNVRNTSAITTATSDAIDIAASPCRSVRLTAQPLLGCSLGGSTTGSAPARAKPRVSSSRKGAIFVARFVAFVQVEAKDVPLVPFPPRETTPTIAPLSSDRTGPPLSPRQIDSSNASSFGVRTGFGIVGAAPRDDHATALLPRGGLVGGRRHPPADGREAFALLGRSVEA